MFICNLPSVYILSAISHELTQEMGLKEAERFLSHLLLCRQVEVSVGMTERRHRQAGGR